MRKADGAGLESVVQQNRVCMGDSDGDRALSDAKAAAGHQPHTLISGGQTGVDRAALDWAIDNQLSHGGWCPKGRKAEDGPLHPRYQLQETTQIAYPIRTRLNVESADATLIIYRPPMGSGTGLTVRIISEVGRPSMKFELDEDDPGRIQAFLDRHQPGILNIAGPRESGCPGIYAATMKLFDEVFGKTSP